MSRYVAYPAYKDSGVEWLGDVPGHWTVERLNDIASIKQSNVDKKSLSNQDEVLLCNYVDVYYNSKITTNLNFMKATASEEEIKKFQLQRDDVIITKDSESPDDIGIAALVIENVESLLCGYHLAIIRDADKLINGGYLYYALSSRPSCHQFLLAAKGVTRFGLSHSNIKNIQLALPKIQEQQQIAHFLDDKTAHLDKLIGQKQQMIGLLHEKRMALITQAVTKGLDLTVPMKDSGVEWLGDVPEHWTVERLNDIASIKQSNVDKKSLANQDEVQLCNYVDVYYNSKITANLNFMKATASEDEIKKFQLQKNDVIITKDSESPDDIGIATLVTENIDNLLCGYHLAIIRDMDNLINGGYLYYALSSPPSSHQFLLAAKGVTRFGLSHNNIKNIQIALPKISEQQQIISYLDLETQKIDAMITTVKQAIVTLQEYRTALITAAVTGKIDVRGLTPADHTEG